MVGTDMIGPTISPSPAEAAGNDDLTFVVTVGLHRCLHANWLKES